MKSLPAQAIILTIVASWLYIPGFSQNTAALTVQIENIEKSEGYMMVAVYDQAEMFLSDNMFKGGRYKVDQAGSMRVSLELPLGEYSISIFHDLNADGELDTNVFKAPTEPIGFSNNAKATFGPPKYEAAKFSLTEHHQTISITLK